MFKLNNGAIERKIIKKDKVLFKEIACLSIEKKSI
jgi:hypothetical protein